MFCFRVFVLVITRPLRTICQHASVRLRLSSMCHHLVANRMAPLRTVSCRSMECPREASSLSSQTMWYRATSNAWAEGSSSHPYALGDCKECPVILTATRLAAGQYVKLCGGPDVQSPQSPQPYEVGHAGMLQREIHLSLLAANIVCCSSERSYRSVFCSHGT